MSFSCPLDTPSSQGLCVYLHVSQALWGHRRGLWVDKVYVTSLSPLGRRSMIMILSLELGQQAQRGKVMCARPRDGAERGEKDGEFAIACLFPLWPCALCYHRGSASHFSQSCL